MTGSAILAGRSSLKAMVFHRQPVQYAESIDNS
jgi:hypothetical protein